MLIILCDSRVNKKHNIFIYLFIEIRMPVDKESSEADANTPHVLHTHLPPVNHVVHKIEI